MSRLYAQFIWSFPYYDPNLMTLCAIGRLLSVAAILVAVGGYLA